MLFRDLMLFAIRLFEDKNLDYSDQGPKITARLIWRDENGTVVLDKSADCWVSHTKPEIIVEMGLYQGDEIK